ncbi:LysR family transcriptional regulator [Undibacterium terreum]|uniref:Transcriptional regulator n=1 Tax=Undibacterium terreum TaxID=1224302 RepID=A0A916U5E7_9BURK|nr:LysR family transcriptional regulator [Undibacterium terreum]GGC58265.1 transcriptional regulator [Undibacterium terreum]
MDELRAITVFAKAAELASFHKVAVEQGTTPQSISKTIRQLESELGVRLFHRTTRQNSLTEDGRRFLEAVKPNLDGMLRALAQAKASASDDEGLIRISAAGAVGKKVLLPMLADFHALHPKIEIELLLENDFTDIVAQRIDVGFRAGSEPVGDMIVRRLFAIQQLACASPSYLQNRGTPASIEDLAQHACIGYRQPSTGRLFPWEFSIDNEISYRDIHAAFCTNDPEAELGAVTAGFGIGLIDSINSTAPIRAGQLIPLLCEFTSERLGLYIYYKQRVDIPRRVRKFIDFSIAHLLNSKEYSIPTAELRQLQRTGLGS